MNDKQLQQQLNKVLAHARKLKASKDKADFSLLAYLMKIEVEKEDILKGLGYASFSQFINTHDLTEPARYRKFKTGVEQLGMDNAKAVGADATVAVGTKKFHDPKKVSDFVISVKVWMEHHNGAGPSVRIASKLLIQVDPRTNGFNNGRGVSKKAELEAENAQLQVENKRLRARVAELEKENAQLRRSASAKKSRRQEARPN